MTPTVYGGQCRIQGGANPAMAPPIEVGNGVWPLGGRKSSDSIVNLRKSNDFGPPVSLSAMDLAPLWKNTTSKH